MRIFAVIFNAGYEYITRKFYPYNQPLKFTFINILFRIEYCKIVQINSVNKDFKVLTIFQY